MATFRAVFGGVEHDLLRLPAYGGNLFDPDQFPFLEGRVGGNWRESLAQPIPVDNRTVLHLLEALQILQVKVPGGGTEPRRLSFRALEVEQIGHVYEGLLDHTIVRASSPVLGLLGTKDKEPEVQLEELEAQGEKGEAELILFLKKITGRSQSALEKLVRSDSFRSHLKETPEGVTTNEGKFLVACNNNGQLWERVKPFAELIRMDTFGYPVIFPSGSAYVTQGSDRRETGTHYTPKSLTEEIVRYTLEPLVYRGVAAGKPKEQWQLKSAAELLNLKICDMAMGSGAFLVQTCRYLAQRLVETWEVRSDSFRSHLEATPEGVTTNVIPEGKPSKPELSETLIPEDADERFTVAKRIVVERCIYGVDKNPLAVEMAKLSLWLETLQKDKPFTFLDHALKCGDSLVGVTLEQLRCWNLDLSEGVQLDLGSDLVRREIEEAIQMRVQIAAKPADTPQEQQEKARLLSEATARMKDLQDRCNLLVSSYLVAGNAKEQAAIRQRLLLVAKGEEDVEEKDCAKLPDLEILRPFHWELEFPEVFLNPTNVRSDSRRSHQKATPEGVTTNVRSDSFRSHQGFDALVGNPPFIGGQKITGILGTPYREYLVEWLAAGKKGSADFCAYFFLRGQQLIQEDGGFGLVATDTIAQGDTREVGLDQLVDKGGTIFRAVPTRPWRGTASLEVAYVWFYQGQWQGNFVLDDTVVAGITPYLTVPGKIAGNPYRLAENQGKSFLGSCVLGMGFVLTPEEAQGLIEKDPRNQEVLFPYLNGQDLNSNPDQSPSRWVINFQDWPLDAEHDDPKKPKGPPYAVDYPDCLAIVEEKVKPERAKVKRKVYRERWWQYAEKRPALQKAIAGCDRVLVRGEVSSHLTFDFRPTKEVYSHKLIVWVTSNYYFLTLLHSSFHGEWTLKYASTRGKGICYTPSDCFETFPFPPVCSDSFRSHQKATPEGVTTNELEEIGEEYYTHRQQIMENRQEGLTKTYNRFHDPEETAKDIQTLRELHIQMDNAVATAYGWTDLPLNHGFHETKQGLRFTISEDAREEVLDRLLQLNHERYAEEVAAGLHDKKKKKAGKSKGKNNIKSNSSPGQMSIDF